MIVAIDGPAGTGKSVLARMISENLGFYLLNTGLFYRALTYQILQEYPENPLSCPHICEIAKKSVYEVENNTFLVNSLDVYPHLRTCVVDEYVSQISAIPAVRDILNEKMRSLNKDNLVCEGRDTTTVIFPDAELKIYLDASIEVRALRRFNEKCSDLSLEEIRQTIAERDKRDKEKPVGALKIAQDAVYIDSSDLTLKEVYEKVEVNIRNRLRGS